ncbi:molecular chaperone HtpG [Oceanibaculum pacificum]|uniref:Chaperone protein HtpG n=1 Tax=Oceanibaculum pacificum TaxID=580166 RepID=A0A154WES7_9PROT|nr:molecular chaperone HtpG [Oceanibaculum pacificum]KZD12031.1 molecular chaperone HtpG [Oceanibaculum pacificum]
MSAEKLSFQAEVSRLLDIVVNSLYSEKEIFLRELISNASDACDKLRYLALTEPALLGEDAELAITISLDKAARTITVADNGIGMNRDELVANLGTIARSGTAAFVGEMSGDAKKDSNLIGQFGVGFYSAFMVAREVEVLTRKAGEDAAWLWTSDGQGDYTVAASEKAARGTIITLRLRDGMDDYLEADRLKQIVRRYSDHIAIPIKFLEDGKLETANRASALWTRSKSEIKPEDYKEFYHHVSHAFDDPAETIHWRAEGIIEYTGLLFIPGSRPFDLFHPERKNRVKLYVRRVFITDDCQELVPEYLRFLRGVIDSEDLPLNVSREMLQSSPVVQKMRQGIVKRVLGDLEKKAEKDAEGYAAFWENFGPVLKEGLYSEHGNERDSLLKLARFRSTHGDGQGDGLVSLADYVGRMKEGQDTIFYITGEDASALLASPQLEGFKAKGVEVLLLTDPIDEFWVPAIGQFDGKNFKSVTRGGSDLSKVKVEDKPEDEKQDEAADKDGDIGSLVALLKLALKDEVKDVRASERLTDSAVCLVADDGDMDMHLERLLRQHKQLDSAFKRILEVNAGHPVIRRLASHVAAKGAEAEIDDAAYLLLDQARIVEGEAVPDPRAFARRLSGFLEKGLA